MENPLENDGKMEQFKTHLILLDETHEHRSLDFNRLTRAIVEGDNEVEEVAFPQIARWLLFEMSSADSVSEKKKNFTYQLV